MMRLHVLFVACAGLLLSAGAFGADPAANDVLKTNGLTASGSAYVLNDELDVLKAMPELRKTKKEFDGEARIRKGLELRSLATKNAVIQNTKDYDQLKDRLTVVTDRTAHNRIVLRMNQLVIKIKEAHASHDDAEEMLAKRDGGMATKYVDDVLALDAKSQETNKKYEQLAADPAVKSAVVKANHAVISPIKLGPSPEFATAALELSKYRSDIDAEAIPLKEEGGVQNLSVLLNGEPFRMTIDSGASLVTLPREIADKLKMTPGPEDPTLQMTLADGHTIQVRQMTLKSVRVGRFTIENVTCAVMAPGLTGAPALLGNSFLSHFVVKFDQKAGQLHLIEVEKEKQPASNGSFQVTGEKPLAK